MPRLHRLQETELAGFADLDSNRTAAFKCSLQGHLQRFQAVTPLEVDHLETALDQLVPEVAHGGKDQGDLVPVMPHIGGFLSHLGHNDDIPPWLA
jgi:hypothetical protein